jgi:thiol-disulfide isomerase/thioredoxin
MRARGEPDAIRRGLYAAVLCALLAATPIRDASAAAVGQRAPICQLAPLRDAQAIDMERLQGSVVYVDFWASWCGPCAKSFPFLNTIEADFRDRGLRVVGINLDEHPADAQAFLSRHPARFAVAADSTGRCPQAFAVAAMPSSYLIDRKGIVRYVHAGFRAGDAAKLRALIERLLSEQLGP